MREIAPRDVIVRRVADARYEIKRVEDTSSPSLEAAHALASVDDPHVSTAMEIANERESRPSLVVMERSRGETLEQRGTLVPSRAVHVAIQIAHALHAAHQAGIIHRNVRPKNVMLVRTAVDDAFVKLTGFGKVSSTKRPSGRKQTRDRFVPPEGNAKKNAGAHTDVFGVGACLAAMLGPARRRDARLARIIARAMADDPKERHATAGELEAELRAWSMGEPTRRRDNAWYALGGLVAIGIGMIAFNEHPPPPSSARPLLGEAHAATAAPPMTKAASPPNAATKDDDRGGDGDGVEIGPPPADSLYAPPSSNPTEHSDHAGHAERSSSPSLPDVARSSSAKVSPTYDAPSGSFYVDEPLRYVSASEGESWRAGTSKKISRCLEMWGMGQCTSLDAMELRCTFDRDGVLHCSQAGGFEKGGRKCSTPVPLEECISRASSGLAAKPKFDRGDVQLAEMKYWLRRAP